MSIILHSFVSTSSTSSIVRSESSIKSVNEILGSADSSSNSFFPSYKYAVMVSMASFPNLLAILAFPNSFKEHRSLYRSFFLF